MSNIPHGIKLHQTRPHQIPTPKVKGVEIRPPQMGPDRDVSDGGGEGFVVFLLVAALAGAATWLFL